jgi:hypothetical protein
MPRARPRRDKQQQESRADDMSQIVERFEAAMQTLLGDGPVKTRLGAAYSACLEDLRQVELPIPGHGALDLLHAAMHSVVPAGHNSPVTASIQKMSTAEASGHARTILRLYTELLAMEQTARAPVEETLEESAGRTPRFLVGGRR